ncbi:hypothetical protein TD95_003900 [Thielaviopsis punctulata]|uniref:Cytochrome b5 heme-binding domain-containing protein n=1 Tax=Thielaviopsis punctulata TaxID=72032 RepID=A0A0F4ZCH7_9PEZI|nr:hypothetical protein TD95_003900 [Thielaviopsis punctulata]
MSESNLRQRKPVASPSSDSDSVPLLEKKTVQQRIKDEDATTTSSLIVDGLRILTFLILASCTLSYLTSGGRSMFWTAHTVPRYLTVKYWKAQFAAPIYLTPAELATYDGSDPSKPLYLAINGTIYDVSASRHIYGPGGSYQYFTGVDSSRAFVTGCFAEDRTPDMRGVEQMFIPLDNPEIDSQYEADELEALRKAEYDAAMKKVDQALAHWAGFFAKNQKYTFVGYVKREDGWLDKLEPRELCAQAQKGRPKRPAPGH